MGLPDLTIVGVAANLGVSHMTLYTHVEDLESLKRLVAEVIFLRWPLGEPEGGDIQDLQHYLEQLSLSMWRLVEQHHGIAPYLLRADMITPAMQEKISAHQADIAHRFDLSTQQAAWLLMTVTHVCVAVADTMQPPRPAQSGGTTPVVDIDPGYSLGVRALITGALSMLPQISDIMDGKS